MAFCLLETPVGKLHDNASFIISVLVFCRIFSAASWQRIYVMTISLHFHILHILAAFCALLFSAVSLLQRGFAVHLFNACQVCRLLQMAAAGLSTALSITLESSHWHNCLTMWSWGLKFKCMLIRCAALEFRTPNKAYRSVCFPGDKSVHYYELKQHDCVCHIISRSRRDIRKSL